MPAAGRHFAVTKKIIEQNGCARLNRGLSCAPRSNNHWKLPLNAHFVATAKLLPCLRMDVPARAFGKEDQLTTA
ncbi:TPA: hypothetical protein QDZ34_003055 [Stenotrophomonas maltophilia]|nr:hypothetical protein [Stenotrophomonas maltophilia]HDS1027511.1 hypothetical protein [Stenotrophomonas maltophilia]HDS1030765.1 hypothetical protein [Stenotrophomonas maltophilia]HDS1035681.1 hypothetical protein [Stenotrophomonas maltophilia]HDS1037280.1 hypothetical protein [Stenotrophomonas maltophilia]